MAALEAVGLTQTSRIGFADDLRLGLRGTTRQAWGRRGINAAIGSLTAPLAQAA